MEYNFESREAYLEWCDETIRALQYANIAMNNDRVKEIMRDIQWRTHVPEGGAMYP